jgi:hypothetical protein
MRRYGLPAVLAALAVIVWAWPVQRIVFWTQRVDLGDLSVYRHYARAMAHGAVPYRDIHIEYPPGATAIFGMVWAMPGSYRTGLSVLMLVFLVACLFGVIATARGLGLSPLRQGIAGGVVALSPLLLGPIVFERFDMAVAAIVSWMVYAAVTERWRLMWVLLALGVLIKIIPIALVPLLLIWQAHRRGWTSAIRGAVLALVIAATGILPFAILSPSGTGYFIAYNLRRPPELESLAANVYLGLDKLGLIRFVIVNDYHSTGLRGSGPALIATGATVLLLVLVVGCAVWCQRVFARTGSPQDQTVLIAGTAATIITLTITGKVLSPQYMMWLLPVTLVIPGWRGRVAIPWIIVALLLTEVLFPIHFWGLTHVEIYPVRLLTLRNLALIALLVVCWPIGVRRRSAAAVLAGPPPASDPGRA